MCCVFWCESLIVYTIVFEGVFFLSLARSTSLFSSPRAVLSMNAFFKRFAAAFFIWGREDLRAIGDTKKKRTETYTALLSRAVVMFHISLLCVLWLRKKQMRKS